MWFGRRSLILVSLLLFALPVVPGSGAPIASGEGSKDDDAARRGSRARPAPRSPDDRGFSITLTSPLERYLLGPQKIAIVPTVPDGDSIKRVDFLIDGRLIRTALEPPYVYETDFGDEIRRHRISVRATTQGGRRARVLYISRSSDLSNGAAVPLEVVPVLVRDTTGRTVPGLKVSDFILSEDGRRQRIVHFDDEPAPTSVAVVVAAPADDATARAGLLQGAARFSESLPPQHALALFDSWDGELPEKDQAREAGHLFSYLRPRFQKSLTRAGEIKPPRRERTLDTILIEAAEALKTRPGGRVVVAFLAPEPPPEVPVPGPEETPAVATGSGPESGPGGGVGSGAGSGPGSGDAAVNEPGNVDDDKEAAVAEETPLAAALEALRRARVGVYAVVLGPPGAGSDLIPAIRHAADDTGGQVLHAPDPARIQRVSEAISDALSNQYLLCYLPEDPDRKGWRSIDLKVRRSELEVRARRVYTRTLDTIEGNGEPGEDSP